MRLRKRLIRQTLGWIFLVLGIFGLVLPILQGLLFIAIGVMLLSPDVPLFARAFGWLRKRYPRVARKAERVRDKITEET